MYVIYAKCGDGRAVYHSEYNDIEACRDAILDLSARGIRTVWSTEYLGPEIRTLG